MKKRQRQKLVRAALTPGTLQHPKAWGIYDTQDKVWLGNNDGPLTYSTETVARLAAGIYAARIPCNPLRIVATPYTRATRRLPDITPKFSAEEAIKHLEEGSV